MIETSMAAVRVVRPDEGRPVPLVDGDGEAVALVWPGMGAEHRSLHRLRLGPGAATVAQQHSGEAVYYVVEGSASVEEQPGDGIAVTVGSMIHVGPSTGYRFLAGEVGAVLVGGPCPPDDALYGLQPAQRPEVRTAGGLRTFHRDEPSLYAEMISRDARFVVWPGVGADHANMNYVRMEPGERNQPHAHTDSEDTIVILSGRGNVDDLTNDDRLAFAAGDVIHVPAGIRHAVCADEGVPVESVGGPCPPDWSMLRALGYERGDRIEA